MGLGTSNWPYNLGDTPSIRRVIAPDISAYEVPWTSKYMISFSFDPA